MPEFRCATCGTYHEPPRCAHKPDAACSACHRPVGFLGYGQPRDGRCNRCFVAADLGIVVRDCAPALAPVADWLGDLDNDPAIMVGSERTGDALRAHSAGPDHERLVGGIDG